MDRRSQSDEPAQASVDGPSHEFIGENAARQLNHQVRQPGRGFRRVSGALSARRQARELLTSWGEGSHGASEQAAG